MVPATSIDEYLKTSLLRKRTPTANPNAESIASISPKVIIADNKNDGGSCYCLNIVRLPILASLATAINNPTSAKLIPII